MKKLHCVLVVMVLGATGFSGTAMAGEESGGFIGLGVGKTSIEFPEIDGRFTADDIGYKVMLGYNFGLLPALDLGIEGAYVNFGDFTEGETEVKQTSWNGFGLIGLSFGPFGLFGKAGMAAWNDEVTIGQISTESDGTDPVYGIGARLRMASVTARLEYEYYDFEETEDNSMASFSLLYNF
ncbi:MAG: porin family protein [Pseudomonadota bacterium]|nr:porin family protein [Pseudomonadota bacterium]